MALLTTKKVELKTIASVIKSGLQSLYGDRLAMVILYGSQARGEASEDSDVDFLYVLRDADLRKGHEIRFSGHIAAKASLDFEVQISLHPASISAFQSSDLIFYQNIRREGIIL